VKHRAIPRPVFLMLVIIAMGVAHLLFASSRIPMLYLGSVVVGLSHGAHWSIMVATASELFGLEHFGGIYNTLRWATGVSSSIIDLLF
jgi:predicted MFS family arabinose efflux permease